MSGGGLGPEHISQVARKLLLRNVHCSQAHGVAGRGGSYAGGGSSGAYEGGACGAMLPHTWQRCCRGPLTNVQCTQAHWPLTALLAGHSARWCVFIDIN